LRGKIGEVPFRHGSTTIEKDQTAEDERIKLRKGPQIKILLELG